MQFIWGLIAGVIVGLVMEWVIDWSGLMPRRPRRKAAGESRHKFSDNSTAANGNGGTDLAQDSRITTPPGKD